jgi:hypothetical protein
MWLAALRESHALGRSPRQRWGRRSPVYAGAGGVPGRAVEILVDRKKLERWGLTYCDSNCTPHLLIKDIRILAGFTGYIKRQCLSRDNVKVFYRGQTKDFSLIPSLFRDIDGINTNDGRLELRYRAYKRLVEETKKLYKGRHYRFLLENTGPILQHYGIRTPWIDLVDNILIAIWFATHRFVTDEGITRSIKSNEFYGWLYYVEMGNGIRSEDLREYHSSLSLRLHTQHAISATREEVSFSKERRDLKDHIVAVVRFPITEDILENTVFKFDYMFPNMGLDNTYKLLREEKFSKLLVNITDCYKLDSRELGNITNYAL